MTQKLLTPEEAIEELKKTAKPFDFAQIICSYLKKDMTEAELKKDLTERLDRVSGGLNKVSHDRVVRSWFSGVQPDRTSVYKLFFALGLSPEKDADSMSMLMSRLGSRPYHFREPPHWRTPEDLIYLYALSHRLSWEETCQLQDRMEEKGLKAEAPVLSPYHFSEPDEVDDRPRQEPLYTDFVFEEGLRLPDEAALEQYLIDNREELGSFHNRAYRFFRDMLRKICIFSEAEIDVEYLLLENELENKPQPLSQEDQDELRRLTRLKDVYKPKATEKMYKLIQKNLRQDPQSKTHDMETRRMAKLSEWIVEFYLQRIIGTDSSDPAVQALQKLVKTFWPTERKLLSMLYRSEDVTRAVLMLLYLPARHSVQATDAFRYFVPDAPDPEGQVKTNAAGQVLRDREISSYRKLYTDLCLMLQACGFAPVDTRHPFDWMIIYFLAAEKDSRGLTTEETIRQFLLRLAGSGEAAE